MSDFLKIKNCIGGVIVVMLPSSGADRGFEGPGWVIIGGVMVIMLPSNVVDLGSRALVESSSMV